VMVGINDLRFEGDSPGNLSSAFQRLIERVATESPNTQIIVQSILPVWGNLNSQVLAANQALAGLAEGDRVVYLDIHSMFADGTGQLSKELTFDGVHLRAVGYLKWRSAIMPFLVR
jgi:lysophospholipase L1-like esterase